jgi:predicted O-linked N-acetylglucosamine transferase (SPINDLY family)
MSDTSFLTNGFTWQPQAYAWLLQEDYSNAIRFYEQAIDAEPDTKAHYWHLGLLLLLQGQEAEAQTTWLFGMSDGEPEQIDDWTAELVQVLQTEAARQEVLQQHTLAWAIRQHIHEIDPGDLANMLRIVQHAIALETLTSEDLQGLGVIEQLQAGQAIDGDTPLLLDVLGGVLAALSPDEITLEFADACLDRLHEHESLMAVLLPAAVKLAFSMRQPLFAAHLLEKYLHRDPENVEVLGHLSTFYQNAGHYDEGIAAAQRRYELTDDLPEKIFSSHLVLRGLMTAGGHWQKALEALQQHEQLLKTLIAEPPTDIHPVRTTRLFTSTYFLPYFRDDLGHNRALQNQVMALCCNNVQTNNQANVQRYQQRNRSSRGSTATRALKIGYLSHCMGRHSVGWLARWLLQYHDRDRFQLYGYFINERQNDALYDWYISQFDTVWRRGLDGSNNTLELADRIAHDEIDILIDLDSITLDLNCEILSLKPAPIQVSWLGWDASGISTVDYFIADPYVLPDWAQDHYPEQIWRLPQTYIAVDGFEVGVPTLRRDQLQIPEDAIIYLSGQKGYKRHADTVRLQMKILAAVPNGYFLIKGLADEAVMKNFFIEIAEAEGVSSDRLRFLSEVASEATHRANLGIADVVLDTFPYNGATTTLETLWMGIPLVTRVGDQFAARNSYTMMMNAGITEGIAWTDEEYVEWGIRLGKEPALRQQVAWKLRQSRHTSALWNGKQFTREMENAYEQMWKIHTQ